MTPLILTLVLGGGMLVLSIIAPALLRHAAPALVRVPRLAIIVVGGGIIVWLASLLALGPVMAWMSTGPVLLPADVAAICQKCLAAANPFSGTATQAAIPAALLLSLPAAIAFALAVGIARQMYRRSRRSRDAARSLLHSRQHRSLHGYDFDVIESDRLVALTFPIRHGGIVLSTATLRTLERDELIAVLAHESAHIRQRHHLIAAVVDSIAVYLPWVPLVRAARDALPHYLEIAADNHARRAAGTTALVAALVKLGEREDHAPNSAAYTDVLHAAGPDRIRHLVQPAAHASGAFPAMAIATYIVILAIISVAVQLPYTSAVLTGC
ncbi:MAG: M56 family metallopeptidase [Microbacterium sp.]